MAFQEWVPQGSKTYVKWKEYGASFKGVFQGLGEGTFAGKPTYHADFLDLDGRPAQVDTPTALRRALAMLQPGTKIEMTYTHDKPNKDPRLSPSKQFTYRIDQPEAGAEKPYDELAALLKKHRPDSAGTQLAALDQLHGDDFVEKRKHLVQMLKTAGVAL